MGCGGHAVRAASVSPGSALWFLIFITKLAEGSLESLLLHRTQSRDLDFYVFHSRYHVLFRVGFWVLCVYVCVYWGDAWFFWKLQIHSPSVTLKPGPGCWKHPGTPPLAPVRMPVRMPVRTYQCSPALPAAGTLCLMRSE